MNRRSTARNRTSATDSTAQPATSSGATAAAHDSVVPDKEAIDVANGGEESMGIERAVQNEVDAQIARNIEAARKIARRAIVPRLEPRYALHLDAKSVLMGFDLTSVRSNFYALKRLNLVTRDSTTVALQGTKRMRGGGEVATGEFSDPDVVLAKVLGERFKAQIPRAPHFKMHWLVVDGYQPEIPENDASGDTTATAAAARAKAPPPSSDLPSPEVATLSREATAFFEKACESLIKAETNHLGLDPGQRHASDAAAKETLAHLSTREGLEEVVPHLTRFAANRAKGNLNSLPALWTTVQTLGALVDNKTVRNLDLYLHEALPVILTCILGEKLCAKPETENHWALRRSAANVLGRICDRFGREYPTIEARCGSLFNECLLEYSARPSTSLFGSVVGLAAMGWRSVSDVLVPRLAEGEILTYLSQCASGGSTGSSNLSTLAAIKTLEEVKFLVRSELESHPTLRARLASSSGELGAERDDEWRRVVMAMGLMPDQKKIN